MSTGFCRQDAFTPQLANAERASNGYLTPLRDGRPYGEALLDPTHIYVGVVEDCLNSGVEIHYAVNVTGHGWRKLMRASEPFAYVVERVPTPHPVFDFIQAIGGVDDGEAYGNFNMGAGFAIYVPESDVATVVDIAKAFPFAALHAGHVESSATKRVVITPKGLEYSADTLGVR